MGNTTYEREGFEWEDCDNLTAKVSSDDIDDCYHENTNNSMTFE